MAAPRRVIEVAISEEEASELERLARSRTEPASRVERARMLLAYRETLLLRGWTRDRGDASNGRALFAPSREARGHGGARRQPAAGTPIITDEARTFIVDLACRKAKDLGYPRELWTTRLLAKHIREQAPAAGHACLTKLAQGTLCKILGRQDIKPHKVRYYLDRRDPEFDAKMAEVLCVHREVELLKQSAGAGEGEAPAVAIVSYDEKPGLQAIGTTAPDLPPAPSRHACVGRDHEYVRHGTLSLLAGIDLLTGEVHASVEERRRSREFVAFLRKLEAAYHPATAIKIILDNHAAHVSRETNAWLAAQPEGRFTCVFTPKHGSWLNLVEGFFSKLARSALRHIRVASKQELKERILAAIDDLNRDPVVHTWTCKPSEAA
jgi:transposase